MNVAATFCATGTGIERRVRHAGVGVGDESARAGDQARVGDRREDGFEFRFHRLERLGLRVDVSGFGVPVSLGIMSGQRATMRMADGLGQKQVREDKLTIASVLRLLRLPR